MTAVGTHPARNQDALGYFPEHRLFAVAKGASARFYVGESAAALVIAALRAHVAVRGYCNDWQLKEGIASGFQCMRELERLSRCPLTTVKIAALCVTSRAVHLAHAVDCRVYRIRFEGIEPLFKDQTYDGHTGDTFDGRLEDLFARGWGKQYQGLAYATSRTIERQSGDIYLVCSPGLHRHIRDDEIYEIVREQSQLDAAARKLIHQAHERSTEDSATSLLVRV